MTAQTAAYRGKPILLFNDECAVCRRLARWVGRSANDAAGEPNLVVRPIGEDPQALQQLSPALDIWDAYATLHLLMPDGTMRLGGEAVAEVLRDVPKTRWLARSFSFGVAGFRPFQMILNVAYAVLADLRPLFGCESCGAPGFLLRPLAWLVKQAKRLVGHSPKSSPVSHFTTLPLTGTGRVASR
jgi:predicted DCC family thiol-disulfide oxidoreductase YuxK